MLRSRTRWLGPGFLFACFLWAASDRSSAETVAFIKNGSFETGDFSGWNVVVQQGGAGTFFANAGTVSPIWGFPMPAPPMSQFAAVSESFGPTSQVLYQDFIVPVGVLSATLSFDRYIANRADAFYTPTTLNYRFDQVGPNQQVRIDIMSATSDPFSVAPGDVLMNLFQTKPGDPLISGYITQNVDLTGLLQSRAGGTLRLRVAATDNVGIFTSGFDFRSRADVIPEPSSLALLGLGALLVVGRSWCLSRTSSGRSRCRSAGELRAFRRIDPEPAAGEAA